MGTKMMLAPPITQAGMPGFLLWARRDNPALYASLQREFPAVAQFEEALRQDQGLSGIADILKSIGGALSKSASSIGKFVVKNALPIATAAVPLVVAKKQADVAKAQVQLAQAQQQPMQTAVQYDSEGNAYAVPVRQTLSASGQSAMDAAGMDYRQQPAIKMDTAVRQIMGTSVGGMPLWALLAAGGLFVAVRMMRNR